MIKIFKNLLNICNKKWYNPTKDMDIGGIKLYRALEVARYIINYANDNKMIISNLKLQKILYFIQLEFLIKNAKRQCFSDEIEAWDFGPVVPAVYHEFKKYGALGIPKITYIYDDSNGLFNIKKVPYESNIIEKDREIINDVVNECSKYSASQLVEITHNHSPWINAYASGKNSVITIPSLIKFINSIPGEKING